MRLFIGVLNKMKKLVKVLSAFSLAALILGFVVSLVEKTVFLKRYDRTCIHKPYGVYEKYFKRPMDFALSLMSIILLSPVLLVTGILVRLKLGSPIIFKQLRPGKNERIFEMYKFRSMEVQSPKKERGAWTVPGDPRVTTVGRIIRRTSIDEMPQFFNILKGDMSLVGPRPERPFFVEKFREEIPRYMIKHQVRPGMTGWAQINGYRGNTSIRKRIEYDLYYIENWTPGFDIIILILTIFKGFVNKNAY